MGSRRDRYVCRKSVRNSWSKYPSRVIFSTILTAVAPRISKVSLPSLFKQFRFVSSSASLKHFTVRFEKFTISGKREKEKRKKIFEKRKRKKKKILNFNLKWREARTFDFLWFELLGIELNPATFGEKARKDLGAKFGKK